MTGTPRALGGERPKGTAAYTGKGFKERTRINGERPIGAASFRPQSTQACIMPTPPLPFFGA